MLKDHGNNASPFGSLLDSVEYIWSNRKESQACVVPTCKATGMVDIKTMIDRAPEVIFLFPERSEHGFENGQFVFTKSHDDIAFEEVLDLNKFLSKKGMKSKKPAVYTLSAIILHQGGVQEGHYVTLAKGPSGAWSILDDFIAGVGKSFRQLLNLPRLKDFSASVFTYVRANVGGGGCGDDEDGDGEGGGDGDGESGGDGDGDDE